MTEFDLGSARPVNPADLPLGQPAFDINSAQIVPQQREVLAVEGTGEMIEGPTNLIDRVLHIVDKSYNRGADSYNLSLLNFEWFLEDPDNPNPLLHEERKRLEEKVLANQTVAEGAIEQFVRGTSEQAHLLYKIFENTAKRGMQGAIAGGTVGLGFAGVGAIPGFFGGGTAGALVAGPEIAFYQMTGDVYAELMSFRDEEGKGVHPQAAKVTAALAGASMAGLEGFPVALMLRLVPGSSKMFGNLLEDVAARFKIPKGKNALINFAINLSTLMAAEQVTEQAQENIQIAAGEVLKMVEKGEFEPISGEEYVERVIHTAEETMWAAGVPLGFASGRLAADVATGTPKKPVEKDEVAEGVRNIDGPTLETIAQKVNQAETTPDRRTYNVEDLTPDELDVLYSAGVDVGPAGTVPSRAATLILVEQARRTELFQKMTAKIEKRVVKEEEAALRKVARGRIRELDKRIAQIDELVDRDTALMTEREAAGKATKAIRNRIDRRLKARELLDEERAGLLTDEGPIRDRLSQAVAALSGDVQVKGADLLKAETRLQKAREQALSKGFKEGSRLARKDVKAAQDAVIEMLESAATDADVRLMPRRKGRKPEKKPEDAAQKVTAERPLYKLSAADKAKFIKQLRNVQTAEQFAEVSAKIQARINTLVTKERRKQATKRLRNVVKGTAAKKGQKGRYGPEAQKVLNIARKALRLKGEAAQARLEALHNLGFSEHPTAEQALEMQLLTLTTDPTSVSAAGIEQLAEMLETAKKTGRGIVKSDILSQERAAKRRIAEVLELMGPEPKSRSQFREAMIAAEINTFLGWNGAWWNKLSRIFASPDKARVDELINDLSLFEESRNFDRGRADMTRRYTQLAMQALNLTSERALFSVLRRGEMEKLNLGSHTHSDGVERSIDVKTRAELRKRIMELMDPQLKKSLMHPKGNAYTPQIIQILHDQLTEQDVRLIQAQLQFYEEYYTRINEAYEKVYYTTLPKLEFYSPIKRRFAKSQEDEFIKGLQYRGGVAPGSLKSRTPSILPIREMGDFTALVSHINEMEYFIAYAEKVRMLDRVMLDTQVQNRIRRTYGDRMVQTINAHLDQFGKRGTQNAIVGEKTIQTLMRNFAFAQLAVKPQIGLKQLASFAAYAQDVDIVDFMQGIAVFAANPRKAIRELSESELFKNRGINIDKDYEALLSDKSVLNFIGKRPTLARLLAINIRSGDKGAIGIGGYAHYYAMMKKPGMTKKKALRSFELITVRTQQSTDPDQVSQLQNTSSLLRVLTQFMSSANSLARAEYNAVVDISRGRITKREFIKRIISLHIVIPNLIQIIANGFTWDDEDQLRASLLGTLNGWFILGDVFEMGVRLATKDPEESLYDLETRHPLSFLSDLAAGIEGLQEDDIYLEDILEGSKTIDHFLKAGGALSGVPMLTLANELRGLGGAFTARDEDDYTKSFMQMLGYSTYTIDTKILED